LCPSFERKTKIRTVLEPTSEKRYRKLNISKRHTKNFREMSELFRTGLTYTLRALRDR